MLDEEYFMVSSSFLSLFFFERWLIRGIGLPRVLENTLPDYLASGMEVEEVGEEWKRYGEWLERGVRVNINVREVFGGSV